MKSALLILLLSTLPGLSADVTGKWTGTATTASGRQIPVELSFKEDAGRLTGVIGSDRGSASLVDVQISGEELSFKIPVSEATYVVTLKVAGNQLKGTFTAGEGRGAGTAVFTRPAAGSLTGTWKLTATEPSGRQRQASLVLKEEEEGKLTGSVASGDGASIPLQDVKLEGGELSFKVTVAEGNFTLKLAVAENLLKGTYTGVGGDPTGPVEARR